MRAGTILGMSKTSTIAISLNSNSATEVKGVGPRSVVESRADEGFAEAVATAADRGDPDTEAVLERLLDGAPAAARWGDLVVLVHSLLRALNHGSVEHMYDAGRWVLEASGNDAAWSRAALEAVLSQGVEAGVETIRANLWGACHLALLYSTCIAKAEEVRGGDPIRWCVSGEGPAHWLRVLGRAKNVAVV